ncbi:MAG: putative nucleotidyltransferase substrate binding domain-containing protein [Oceanibaculum nanhaiense]|jgi:CBS domain-containing protein|uniref:putative nucleotidyltransferase substrate binding domain-containing protein n=1 Tax=Oceanibaculum nanhaiense TaxID=1909734 RepID=UPI0032EB70EC
MNADALQRLDSFPYRHRVAEVMASPVVTMPEAATVKQACDLMIEKGISSVMVTGDAGLASPLAPPLAPPLGIVTERDALRLIAEQGAAALDAPLSRLMSSPVEGVPQDAFVYLALGRMDRLGVRHLAVFDTDGAVVGILSARQLLRQRAGSALAIGDRIGVAQNAEEMAEIVRGLPDLASSLLAEQVAPLDVAAVISGVMRDVTGRAARLSAEAMQESGWGVAPAPWCALILGSGGRGESLLAPDQDNGILHAGTPKDDAWYAELGRRMADMLNESGIPYCKGGVMAKNPEWRHDETGWRRAIDIWAERPIGENLLNVDIFFDFQSVEGQADLAELLRAYALDRARKTIGFLRNLSLNQREMRPPLGFFGGIQTIEGRVDLKIGGLLPVVSAARILALKGGVAATATADRLREAASLGLIAEADAADLAGAHRILVRLVLEQQIEDIAAGRKPGTRVELARLTKPQRHLLREVLRRIGQVPDMVQDALSA